jgi:hypothetical protein
MFPCSRIKKRGRPNGKQLFFLLLFLLGASTVLRAYKTDTNLSATATLHCGTSKQSIFCGTTRKEEKISGSSSVPNKEFIRSSLVNSSSSSTSNYAYAFVICGVWPEQPSYRGYLFNILVSTKILRQEGSTADVVVLVQMDYRAGAGGDEAASLPLVDLKWLERMGIHVQYIPPSNKQNFYNCMLEKFRILTLLSYKRVLFLDGDIMPLTNLDYLFHFSEENNDSNDAPKLMQNLVVAGHQSDPATGGFFMLTPKKGDFEELLNIVHRRESRAKRQQQSVGYKSQEIQFNEMEGWGHVITPPDKWLSKTDAGTKWDFQFAYADPGLLYHWTKYVKQSVSLLIHKDVHNWSTNQDGTLVLQEILKHPFLNVSKPRLRIRVACQKWICDFYHFSSSEKPWLHNPPFNFRGPDSVKYAAHHWFFMLAKLNDELSMGLNFSKWQTIGQPILGFWPRPHSINERINNAV